MMNAMQIATFLAPLDVKSETARHVRANIYRIHTGRWPTLRAISMRRDASEVVEVAKLRYDSDRPYVVIRWSLHRVRDTWIFYRTLREARAQAGLLSSMDSQHANLGS